MPTPKRDPQECLRCLQIYEAAGENYSQGARDAGYKSVMTFKRHVREAEKWEAAPEGQKAAIEVSGLDLKSAKHGWRVIQHEDGSRDSVFWKVEGDNSDDAQQVITDACDYLRERSVYVAKDYKDLGDHLLVITPADIHMGKLSEAYETGDEYTQEIAERRTKEGIAGLLQMAQFFGIEAITINTGNDSLHVDNSKNKTTAGTDQDTQGSIFSMFTSMQRTWIWIIEQCALVAPVRVVFDPSNHPWVSDWMLNQSLAAWFHADERVSFDIAMSSIRHRKYQVYGSSLIGFTHGDGAKSKDLPMIMQHECREWWGKTKRGYWITKHLHHKDAKLVGLAPYQSEKDHPGVTVIRSGDMALDRNVAVEVVRSPSGTDGWHDRNGFVGAIKAVEAFLFHHERGQVTRFTHPFY